MDLGIPREKAAEPEVEQSKRDLGLRHIDRILLSVVLQQYLKGIYTKFLGLSDHKCVILTLTARKHSCGAGGSVQCIFWRMTQSVSLYNRTFLHYPQMSMGEVEPSTVLRARHDSMCSFTPGWGWQRLPATFKRRC